MWVRKKFVEQFMTESQTKSANSPHLTGGQKSLNESQMIQDSD